jgi:hypothetical protein
VVEAFFGAGGVIQENADATPTGLAALGKDGVFRASRIFCNGNLISDVLATRLLSHLLPPLTLLSPLALAWLLRRPSMPDFGGGGGS